MMESRATKKLGRKRETWENWGEVGGVYKALLEDIPQDNGVSTPVGGTI